MGQTANDATAAGNIARRFDTADVVTPPREDKRGDLLRRIRRSQVGTYISDILDERDSALARWPDRHGRPLTVWIQPATDVPERPLDELIMTAGRKPL